MNKRRKSDPNVSGYVGCMDEIKERISDIDYRLNVPPTPGSRANIEALALNFRKVFELIVMACQAAHEHKIGRPVREWRIKNIEAMLAGYNSDFFMGPVQATSTEIRDLKCKSLTLSDLKDAHHRCGAWLHAWTPYIGAPDVTTALHEFRTWRDGTVRLLNAHRVRIDRDHFLYCCMNAAGSGQTHVCVFTRQDAPTGPVSPSLLQAQSAPSLTGLQ